MRIGISPFASSADGAVAIAETAVRGGLDTLWLGDGYLHNPDFPDWAGGMESLTELGWLSGRVTDARIGITAAVLTLRDPVWTAKQANTLHRLAGGGFVLVLTPGFRRADLEARGLAHQHRGGVFAEAVDELVDALDDPSYGPGPPSQGPPPVWLAGERATMDRALARGLPFQSSRLSPEDLAPLAAELFDRGGVMLAHRIRVQVGDRPVRGEEVDWRAVTGTVDQIVDSLARYRELGVADLSVVPGQDDATSLATVETLVADVLPQLR